MACYLISRRCPGEGAADSHSDTNSKYKKEKKMLWQDVLSIFRSHEPLRAKVGFNPNERVLGEGVGLYEHLL